MLARIKTNWNLPRVLFLLMGSYICFESVATNQWIGIFPGLYFATMGLLGLGCAGGNCAVPYANTTHTSDSEDEVENYVEVEPNPTLKKEL